MALPPKEISFLIQDILLLQVIVLQFLLVFLGEVKLLKDEVIDASGLFFHLIEGGFQPVSPDTGNHLDGTDDDLVPDMADASQMQKERERLEARNREIDEMFLNLYTDKAKGILSEQRFIKLTATMEQEQEENQHRLQELLRMLQQSDAQESEVRTFIREIRQYATIQELDETVLNRLISCILVGEVRKVDGQKVQEVRIVYNFVGEIV